MAMVVGISQRAKAAWRRRDNRPIYDWSGEFFTLPASYALPGRFDISVNRPLIDVFDAIKDPTVRRVRFRGPPRFGKSLISDLTIPWVVCNDPGPIMWNWQKEEAAIEHMREKAWPLWNSCEPFRVMLPRGRHEITTTEIYFGPFFLKVQGANPNNFQGKGIRWMINEEVWLPVWQDLYNQAVSRTRDYARSQSEKVIDVSQAGNKGDVEDRNFSEGHQSVWSYKAPNGQHYPLVMHGKRPDGSRYGLTWADDARRSDGSISLARAIETVRYVCKETGHVWEDSPKTIAEWNRDGRYLAQNADAPADIRSFAVNALLNNSFADLVRRKVAAMQLASYGNMTGLRDAKMQDEVLPWSEEYLTVTISSSVTGYKVADHDDGKPLPGEKYRTMMADRQRGMSGDSPHRWCEVRVWFTSGSSRQIFFDRTDTKEAMRELQHKYHVPDRCVWQDAHFETHKVYEECAQYGWIACWGSEKGPWVHILPDPNDRRKQIKARLPYSPWQTTMVQGKEVYYLHFMSDYCKDILAGMLRGTETKHECPDDVLPAYKEHLQAEHKVPKGRGYTWEKLHSTKPNHGWDTSVQGIAFALLMKLLAMPNPPDESAGQT